MWMLGAQRMLSLSSPSSLSSMSVLCLLFVSFKIVDLYIWKRRRRRNVESESSRIDYTMFLVWISRICATVIKCQCIVHRRTVVWKNCIFVIRIGFVFFLFFCMHWIGRLRNVQLFICQNIVIVHAPMWCEAKLSDKSHSAYTMSPYTTKTLFFLFREHK